MVRRGPIWILLGVLGWCAVAAQEPARLQFEVASVRPAPELRGLPPSALYPPRDRPGGRFEATATLRNVIRWAFKPQIDAIEGSFRDLDDVFMISAKAPGAVVRVRPGEVGPLHQMLQSLLAERFKLRVRWETRSVPVYALQRSTAELGRNVKPIDVACPQAYADRLSETPHGCFVTIELAKGHVKATVPSITYFANFLSQFAGRRVVDDTGLAGSFELITAFNPRSEDAGTFPAEDLPSLREALRNDLGFKLVSERRDFQALIVEHVEQPTEN